MLSTAEQTDYRASLQCDFNLPERFDMSFIAPDGSKQRVRPLAYTLES